MEEDREDNNVDGLSAAVLGRAGPSGLARLLDAVISLSSHLDLSDVLRRIIQAGVDLTGARYGALGVLDEARGSLAEFITVGIDDETRQKIGALPKGRGLLGALITDAHPLRVADLREYPGRSGFPEHHPPMTSFLGVPIRVRGEVFGNLYLTDRRNGEVFTDVDEELAVGLASAAGVAIDNARLFDQLKRRETALAAVHEIATSVSRGANPVDTLGYLAKQARLVASADVASFALVDPDGETLVMGVTDGALAADLVGLRFPRAGSISGDVLASGQTAVFSELFDDPRRVQPQVFGGAIGPAIFVGLTTATKPLGSLFVGRARGAPAFASADVDMVRSFAAQAEVALDTAARRQALTRMALLEEQERIARDLHDTVIQQLFAVGLSLQGLTGMTADELVRTRISRAVDDLNGVIRQIRSVIFEVSTTSQPLGPGLRGELLAIAKEAARSLGYEPSVTLDGPIDTLVGDEMAKTILATAREALANVARHAHASRVEVTAVAVDKQLTLRVVDDGVGIPDDGSRRGGRGLRNMRARAEDLGGHLTLAPGAGDSGTVIEWVVPLA